MIHPAKVDRWVPIFLGCASLLATAVGAMLLVGPLVTGQSLSMSTIGFAAFEATMGLLFGLALKGCYHIRYEITPGELMIRFAPFHMIVPLASIIDVYPTRNPFTAPAPSLDRLQINYRPKPRTRRFALISPKDKEAFLRDLATAAPHLRPAEGNPLRLIAEAPAISASGR